MRPVTHDYQSLNEYTLPLQGKPYYRSSGIIYAVDRNGNKYAVGRVDLERFDDQNFQYVFTPEWSVIDTLPSSIFQGMECNRYPAVLHFPGYSRTRHVHAA